MRRPAPALPISPKLLKHFAAATVAITALIAMFAGGEDTSVAAQIQATQARNDLIATQQQKLGTKTIANHLRVNTTAGFGDEDGGGGFSSGGGAAPSRPSPRNGVDVPTAPGSIVMPPPQSPGADKKRGIVKPRPGEPGGDGEDAASASGDTGSGGPPIDPGKLGAIADASRQRSGSAGRSGD